VKIIRGRISDFVRAAQSLRHGKIKQSIKPLAKLFPFIVQCLTISRPRQVDYGSQTPSFTNSSSVRKLRKRLNLNFLNFGRFWKNFLTQILTQKTYLLVTPHLVIACMKGHGSVIPPNFFTASQIHRITSGASIYMPKVVHRVVQPKMPHLIDPTLFSHFHISSLDNLGIH